MKFEPSRVNRPKLLTDAGYAPCTYDVGEGLVLAAKHAIDNGAECGTITSDHLMSYRSAGGEQYGDARRGALESSGTASVLVPRLSTQPSPDADRVDQGQEGVCQQKISLSDSDGDDRTADRSGRENDEAYVTRVLKFAAAISAAIIVAAGAIQLADSSTKASSKA